MRRGVLALLIGGLVAAPLEARAPRAKQPRKPHATWVSDRWQLPKLTTPAEPAPTETLADALDAAYRSSPALQARRYDLRATDEDYAQALAELRPTAQLQVTGNFTRTLAGRITQGRRSFADQLKGSTFNENRASAEVTVDQPLYTGGRATADALAGSAAISAGREELRATEGDLFLRVISAYAAIRRDGRTLALRKASIDQIKATLDEVTARREAGELTRTDIAQAATQLDAAIATANIAEQQLDQDRSSYAALVGHDPGVLAPEPGLPQLPRSLDEAFDLAQRLNPELSQAVAAERTSRARIAAAAAEEHPRLSVRGSARLGGQAVPLHTYNQDQEYTGQAVLTVPLTQGGMTSSRIEQARDRNAADRARIEGARRSMVQQVIDAWNGVSTAQRNLVVQQAQLKSAQVLDEGTFEEYRAGLRSTFDVLFAHGSLRDAEIALVSTRHDLYVAQASLLRQMGLLEARAILSETPLYQPDANTREAAGRNALPWDPALRAFDRVGKSGPPALPIEQPGLPDLPPRLLPATPMPVVPRASQSPGVPLPGTVGHPIDSHEQKRP